MKVIRLKPFLEDYKRLPVDIQKRLDKQLEFLIRDPRHSSLRRKKIRGTKDIWEVRVTREYRMTFCVRGDRIVLRRVGTHDILRKP